MLKKALALFKAVGAVPKIKQTETLLDTLNSSKQGVDEALVQQIRTPRGCVGAVHWRWRGG
jgi:hypothetical protein